MTCVNRSCCGVVPVCRGRRGQLRGARPAARRARRAEQAPTPPRMQRDMTRDDDASDAKIVHRYLSLMDRSKEAVALLAGLPQYAFTCTSMDPFVAKAFEGLSELWKLQLRYRETLTRAYNIKRWEIGEIASRLGQLHYISYLRKGDPEALRNAFQYYQVIVARNYFELPAALDRHVSYIVRKIRFLARYALVCIHLDKVDELEDAIRDMRSVVDTLKTIPTAIPDDVSSYQRVIVEGEKVVEALKRDVGINFKVPTRYLPVGQPQNALTIKSAVFAVNQECMVKFSELPLATLRLGQTLEYDQDQRVGSVGKTFMYRPTVSGLIAQVAAVVSRLEASNHALVLYINANAVDEEVIFEDDAEGLREHDLFLTLRRPLLLILEGRGMQKWFAGGALKAGRGQKAAGFPLMVMVSEDQSLTRYLCSPIAAVLDGRDLPSALEDHVAALDSWSDHMLQKLKAHPALHPDTAAFMSSPFGARYITRFMLSHTAALSLRPTIYPPLPRELLADASSGACIEQIQAAE